MQQALSRLAPTLDALSGIAALAESLLDSLGANTPTATQFLQSLFEDGAWMDNDLTGKAVTQWSDKTSSLLVSQEPIGSHTKVSDVDCLLERCYDE